MKTETTTSKQLHEYYLDYLSDSGIDKERSTSIEDLVYEDVEDDGNNYEILMGWINWIFDNIVGALKFAKIYRDDSMCGLKIRDSYENEFSMIQHTITPLTNLTNDEVLDICIELKKHDLTQDTEVSFWEVDYKYASGKEV